jgi:hypothetical protein
MGRAIKTIEQPPDRRRLYRDGLQPHTYGSSWTPNEVIANLVLQLLHFLVAEEYEDGRPSSTLLIYFASVLGISIDGLTFERPSNYTPKLSGLSRGPRNFRSLVTRRYGTRDRADESSHKSASRLPSLK